MIVMKNRDFIVSKSAWSELWLITLISATLEILSDFMSAELQAYNLHLNLLLCKDIMSMKMINTKFYLNNKHNNEQKIVY